MKQIAIWIVIKREGDEREGWREKEKESKVRKERYQVLRCVPHICI